MTEVATDTEVDEVDLDIIDLDAVAEAVRALGVDCAVEQTGGNCATLCAGPMVGDRHTVVAGPGWFEGPGWTRPRASLAEFFIGSDDDGETKPYQLGPRLHGGPSVIAVIIFHMVQSRVRRRAR